ncbi:MAG TPA: amidohydrolase [Planctomycetota bacterium]|nr:amidohydrolase [Planctomycetota bacterium]
MRFLLLALLSSLFMHAEVLHAAEADLILHSGKIVTVDRAFSIQQAVAIGGGKLLQVGSNDAVLKLKGAGTEVIDLQGKTVIPGLIDSHVHPAAASLTEFDHDIPTMEKIQDVLDYIAARAKVLPTGKWIHLQQVFITRLKEQRYPTRAEMDRVAPEHPVLFRTGPDASLNSLALKLSAIDRNFKVSDGGPGFIEKDSAGEPTGILRNCTRFVKVESTARVPTDEEKRQRLRELFKDYNAVGLTAIGDRDTGVAALELYRELRKRGELTLRVAASASVPYIGSIEQIQERIRTIAVDTLFKERDEWLRIIGIKTYLDGGMLTGSAYMREPWGLSKTYSITDPAYRGVLFIPPEKLSAMVRTTVEAKLQFTAHAQGDGAVQTLLETYESLAKELPVRETRPCVTHASFQSKEAIELAAKIGAVMDIQPAWLYLDASTLVGHFGYERLRYFVPLKSHFDAGVIVGGGSDHMQKIGSLRAINLYNPFLGMATAITRRARWYEGRLHPEESLTREQALRFYTINNAYLLFSEDRIGSLEPGKLADLVVLDRDLLTCPEDDIAATKVLRTYIAGKLIYSAP